MVLILSLFLICAVIAPTAGESLRRRSRLAHQRKRLDVMLRDGDVADYHLD